jgi:hypothetical protein
MAQQQPVEEPIEDQVEQAQRHARDLARPLDKADHRRSEARADFWNPTSLLVGCVRRNRRQLKVVMAAAMRRRSCPTAGHRWSAACATFWNPTGCLVFRSFLALSPVRGSWGHAGDAWFVDLEG